MFGLLACPTYRPIDPWERFQEELVRPFVELNLVAALGLVALAAVGTLLIGLFADLSPSERSVCGALPLIVGVGAFIVLAFASPRGRWWDTRSAEQSAALPLAWTVGALGLLVVERRRFIVHESLPLQRGHHDQ